MAKLTDRQVAQARIDAGIGTTVNASPKLIRADTDLAIKDAQRAGEDVRDFAEDTVKALKRRDLDGATDSQVELAAAMGRVPDDFDEAFATVQTEKMLLGSKVTPRKKPGKLAGAKKRVRRLAR